MHPARDFKSISCNLQAEKLSHPCSESMIYDCCRFLIYAGAFMADTHWILTLFSILLLVIIGLNGS